MKILVVTSSYPRFEGDGSAPFVKSICENLAALGNQVSVIAPFDIDVKKQPQTQIEVHRFKYILPLKLHIMGHARSLDSDVKLKPLTYLLIIPYLFFSFITSLIVAFKFKPEIIHVHWVIPNGPVAWLLSKITKVPYVVTLHGSDIFVANKNRVFRKISNLVFRNSLRITACSLRLAENAKTLGGKDKVVLLPWGADPVIFSPDFKSSDYKAKNNIPQEAAIILALGRMVYKKGFANLIDIWPQVLAEYPDTYLIIGGDGPIRNELQKKVRDLNIPNILLPGKIPWNVVPEFLANGDIFVLPSIRDHYGNEDGLPTVLLEAMSSGLPVIASEIGGVSLVVQNGHNGVMVAPGNKNQLKVAINQFLENKDNLKVMGKNARADVVEKYNWRNVAIKLIEIFTYAIIRQKNG